MLILFFGRKVILVNRTILLGGKSRVIFLGRLFLWRKRRGTLPKTNSLLPKIGHPKRKLHLPSIHFQRVVVTFLFLGQ